MVVSGTSQFAAKVVYEIGRRGVFGRKFVWMTFNLVYGMNSLGPDYYQYLEGLVTGGPCIYEDAPNKPEFLKALRNVINETFDWRTYTTLSVQGYFDCTMIMLLGLHSLHADPVELSERKAQPFMNHTLFHDLNYFGYTTLDSTKLDSRGDVQMPVCFTRFTGINDTYTSFGFSSDDSLSIARYNEAAPKFYGGASIPPPDGPPITEPEYYSLATGKGQTLLVMSILGISASLFCVGFILYNRKVNEIKASIVPEMVVITIGCLTSYASLLLYISVPTSAICKSRATLPFVSLMLVAIPLLLKNMTIIWLFSKRVIVKARVISKMKCTAVLCELVILAVDGTMLGLFIVHSNAIVLTVPGNNDSSYFRCSVVSDTNSSLLSALYVFNALIVLLLLAAAYASTRVTVAEYSEITQLTFIPLILIIAFALEKGIQSYSEDANLDFKIALIHWCLTTAVLYFMIGKRMLVVYRNWRLSAYEKRIAADASQPKQSVAAARASLNRCTRVHEHSFIYRRIDKTCTEIPFYVQTSIFQTPLWDSGKMTYYALGNKRKWFSINAKQRCYCTVILNTSAVSVVRDSMLLLAALDGSKIFMEFKSREQALAVLDEMVMAVDGSVLSGGGGQPSLTRV
ncbi:hypothetical protein HDU78_002814 [Chytriomyces hyalinus]|nr:hypothetical protein HDU78_002814 [Chytriomyces hyalinus]